MVYEIAELAGLPIGILNAYRAYLEAVLTYNAIVGGFGHAHQREAGIPKGCSFSVMIVALLMRSWIMMGLSFSRADTC